MTTFLRQEVREEYKTKLYAPQNLTLDCSPPGYPPSRLLTVVN